MLIEIAKFIIYSIFIVAISKYILVKTLRKLAENLKLKPQTVGDIAGYATSVPELLTIGASSFSGLLDASIVNVLSSNVINLIQYLGSILFNKNRKAFKNNAIKINLILVAITILIPMIFFFFDVKLKLIIVPIFIIFYLTFYRINRKVHLKYLRKEDEALEKIEAEKQQEEKKNHKKTIIYVLILFATSIALFIIGNLLGDTLEKLCYQFNISQTIVGILLGFITSIPELITFFEAQKHYKKQESDDILGVVEATNNLLTSNILNLFVIQSIGIVIYNIMT